MSTIGADGSDRRRLTSGRANEAFPSWAPGGGRIAFASDRGRSELSYQVYVMDARGRGRRRLTSGRASHFQPVWQPTLRR